MTAREFERRVADSVCGIKGEIVVGVSGGADSTALLVALHAVGKPLFAVTCDFHLRGEESTRDRRFVGSLCRRLGVECLEADIDVEGWRREHGGSVEMACRDTRYALFRRTLRERGAARIAVAHNADDNVETLLLNLFRGTGIEGLRGMEPDTGEIIRPLLGIGRRGILEYLAEKGEEFVTDSTNLESEYRRNFIRNRVLPLIEERWPGMRDAVALTQRNLRGEAAVLRHALAPAQENILPWKAIRRCGDARTMIHRFASRFGASASQIDEITRHSAAPRPGCYWPVRDGEISSERDGLYFDSLTEEAPQLQWTAMENTPAAMATIRADRSNTAFYSSRKPENYMLRGVRAGDRIAPLGMKGTMAVSDIMKDAKLARRQKRLARVLCDAATGEILWLEGLKRSRHDLVAPADPVIFRLAKPLTPEMP
jgi:tRNA(Ile)-lysidine synthase